MKRSKRVAVRRRPRVAPTAGIVPGTSPGTITAPLDARPTTIRLIAYDKRNIEEREIDEVSAIGALDDEKIAWIDVVGLADIPRIEELGSMVGLHPLALEDVVNTQQRAKAEEFGDQLFVITRMPAGAPELPDEQISIFIGKRCVVTFQERPGDCLEPVRNRLRRGHARIRSSGTDYLAYALIDAVTDHYFPLLEQLGERLERLEDTVLREPTGRAVEDIHAVKRELLNLRRALWPQREMVNVLTREDSTLIHKTTRIYLRSCYDHVTQLMDIVETCREIASGLVDIHLSAASTRLNEIMKVLTVIASIFIPLSFIAGVYGMNFDPAASAWNMPELGWRLGYPFALGLMAATAAGLLIYFRVKRWIGAA